MENNKTNVTQVTDFYPSAAAVGTAKAVAEASLTAAIEIIEKRWGQGRAQGYPEVTAALVAGLMPLQDFSHHPNNSDLCAHILMTGDGTEEMVWDCDYAFCLCQHCGAVGFEYSGRSERIPCCEPNKAGHKEWTASHPTLMNAYRSAVSMADFGL
jgi:hypothetical protein